MMVKKIDSGTSLTKAKPSSISTLMRRLPPFHQAWTEVLINSEQPHCEYAIELCCGQTPKIGIAISQLKCATHVGYIDSSHSALLTCKEIICKFNQLDNAFFLNSRLQTLNPPEPFNLITGNHIFDDLLLQHYIEEIHDTNEHAYKNKKNYMTIVNQAHNFFEHQGTDYLETLAKQFSKLLSVGGRLIFSDYHSYYETKYGILNWPKFRFFLCDKFSDMLCEEGFRRIPLTKLPTLFERVDLWEKQC